jgi:DAK2 domain fusion protein YloV
MSSELSTAALVAIMGCYRDVLNEHRAAINALNVYPVPDGDTGTNMSLTIEAVCRDLDAVDQDDLEAVTSAIAHGSLMGARGNSGVILSQVLRGLAGELEKAEVIDAAALTSAFEAAAEGAYAAVMNPVEGTILTVARVTAEAATASSASDLVVYFDELRNAAQLALDQTPTQLKVLADAGVVDAGGTGFVRLLDAVLHVLDDRAIPVPELIEANLEGLGPSADDDHQALADLRYEVMYFLDAPDDLVDGFKARWVEVGDSIVVVGGDGTWNCHIHTDDIGEAVEAGIEVGRPYKIRVTDLLEEVSEQSWVTDALGDAEIEPVHCSAVAVAVGSGVANIFRSLGVQVVVEGGQTMNPSTEQLVAAVSRIPADQVLLLPNNKNIIAVAEQVDSQVDKTVIVLPTRSVAEGFAALVAYDPEAEAVENERSMNAAADSVEVGEVTQAVRASTSAVGEIVAGDWLGLSGSIRVVSSSVVEAACGLLDTLVTDEHEIVTIIAGVDATEPETSAVVEWLAVNRPDVEAEVHVGGQPLYPYYFGVE